MATSPPNIESPPMPPATQTIRVQKDRQPVGIKPPDYPETDVGRTRFPTARALKLQEAISPDKEVRRKLRQNGHHGLLIEMKKVQPPTPEQLPKSLADKLLDIEDHIEKCDEARIFITTQLARGCSMERIAKVLKLEAGHLIEWSVSRPQITSMCAVALQQSSEVYDELARSVVDSIIGLQEINVRVAFGYANSLRCGAEAQRSLFQGLLKKIQINDDSRQAIEREQSRKGMEKLRKKRAEQAKTEKQEQARRAHEATIKQMGGFPSPPPINALATNPAAPPNEIEFSYLMPHDLGIYDELRAAGDIDGLEKLMIALRERWRGQHQGTVPTWRNDAKSSAKIETEAPSTAAPLQAVTPQKPKRGRKPKPGTA